MNKSIEEVKKFIDNGYAIQIQAKEMCIDILKNELGGLVDFDWEDGDAPSISSVNFDDDLVDAYISRLYLDNGVLIANLHAYYIGRDAYGIFMSDEYETNYLDILEYLNNLRDEKPIHRIIDTCYGEVMLKDERLDNNGSPYCQVYNGDNYDNFIGEVGCSLNDDDETIKKQIEKELF